jgi:hypothetical protein
MHGIRGAQRVEHRNRVLGAEHLEQGIGHDVDLE